MDTKIVKIGGRDFEIQACLSVVDAVECWKNDSERLEKIVKAIGDLSDVSYMIVDHYCKSKGYHLVPKNNYGVGK